MNDQNFRKDDLRSPVVAQLQREPGGHKAMEETVTAIHV